MLVGSQPARNASGPTADDGMAEPTESCAELRIGDPGEPFAEHLNLIGSELGDNRLPRRRIERQKSLHQHQAGDDGTPEKEVDALDQQRRAVLQLECGRPRLVATAKSLQPNRRR